MLIAPKSTGSEYTAAEWTQINSELNAAIEGSNVTASASVLTQLRESIMRNITAGRDCVASGTANAIVLTTRAPFSAGAPSVYQAGATYSAQITVENTGATTININGLGVISVKKNNFADELDAGDIVAGLYEFVLNQALDAVQLVAKVAVAGGGGGASVWDTETSKTGDYTILEADSGNLIYQGSATAATRTFTFDAGFPDKGVVWIFNQSPSFLLKLNDGTDDILSQFIGDNIYKYTKSALTGEINITEA